MAAVPRKVSSRMIESTRKFQRILKRLSDRDINEADTVKVVSDMLSEVFGYDEYTEITREYAIRGTYCDLAVKINNDVKYLIEVKAISVKLNDGHLRQAIGYGANEGIQWIVLTNGVQWYIYNLQLKKTIQTEKVFEIDFLNINARKKEDQELLFLLAREGLSKNAMQEYQERVQTVNPHMISAIMLNKPGLDTLRRELRRITPGLKVEVDEIEAILRNEVIKRSILEDDEGVSAMRKVKRMLNKAAKKKVDS